MTGEGIGNVWLLTDRRYLGQRMPRAVAEQLEDLGRPARVVVADDDCGPAEVVMGELEPSVPWNGLEPGDLVVTRSRHPYALALLQLAEAVGGRALDSWSAVQRVRDKVRCTIALARRTVPIPPTFLAHRPSELASLPRSAYPLILKPVLGDNARGLRIVREAGELGGLEWTDDVVLAQSYLDADSVDLKVYVAGDAIWAVRRPSPLADATAPPVDAPVTEALRGLVDACRSEFGLRLFGLDILELREGPVVVDVNEFPNYTGVQEAPAVIARMLVEEAAPLANERVLVEA